LGVLGGSSALIAAIVPAIFGWVVLLYVPAVILLLVAIASFTPDPK